MESENAISRFLRFNDRPSRAAKTSIPAPPAKLRKQSIAYVTRVRLFHQGIDARIIVMIE
jgi:hypothetical protein